jgi:UDP-N-acetylmuramoyl-tripeptide--D-alanyl-D-alanine ligase
MDPTPLRKIAEMAGARILQGDPSLDVERIGKDSRTVKSGELYVALRGDRFDGNLHAAEALEKGAAAVLMDNPEAAAAIGPECPVLLAEDSLEALQRLARAWRDRLDLRAVGITGSNGKTSVKEFTAAVLARSFRTVKTTGNLNNHIGVPLSILSASTTHEAAVWEAGMNHAGEIAPLAALIRPHCAIITNIGTAHIGNLGSRQAIAEEKAALAEAVPETGTVVLDAGDDFTDFIAGRCRAKILTIGIGQGDLSATDATATPEGNAFRVTHGDTTIDAFLPVQGLHMVKNALLALAAGIEFGIPLEKGVKALAGAKTAAGRMERKVIRGIACLDDTYNANPDSMVAALESLRLMRCGGHRIAVLGKMGELGEHALEGCRRTGEAAASCVDILITVGEEAAPIAEAAAGAGLTRVHQAATTSSGAAMLRQIAREGDCVLVKGSRAAAMETLLEHFAV